jgi:long-chain acyl-CoA synthetase
MSALSSVNGPPLEARITALSGETLVDILDLAAARSPGSISQVLRRGMVDERWTCQQLAERSARVAEVLRGAGIRHGDRVLTWSQNDPWLVAAYFGVWRLGAIIVPLDLRMQTDVAVRIGVRSDPSLLLAGEGVDPDAAAALGVPILSVDEAGLTPTEAGLTLSADATGASSADRPFADVSPDDVAEILFTSGTTSDPKGVVLTHGQIMHTVRAIAQTAMGSKPDRALAIIPLSHMYGQSVPLLMGLMGGSSLVFLHALSPKAVSATMQREHITAITLAPHYIRILLQGIESEARRSGRADQLERARRIARWLPFPLRRLLFRSVLSALGGALEIISSGGAMLDEDLQEAWETFGIRVIQGYGTTECAAVCGHSRTRQRAGTVGPPLAGVEVRIAADGELLVRAPNVMTGYWKAPEATAEVLDPDGWFHTGDAARIDEHAEVVIQGRTRDRISLPNGLNVYPEDVEGALVATGQLRSAVVFEPTPGQIAAALVPIDKAATREAMAAAVRTANATLAPHQKVGTWRRWPEDDFPRTHTLKVRREPVKTWCASAIEEGSSGSVTASTSSPAVSAAPRGGAATVQAVQALISTMLRETRGADGPTIGPGTELSSLDLDSLAAVTLALRIDEAFDAPLSDDEVAGAHDVEALCALVQARQGQPPAPPASRWAFSPAARGVRRLLDATLIGWTIDIVARPQVEGLEHLESLVGPALICPNHTSHLDAPVVRAALPRPLCDHSAIAAAADVWFDGSPLGPMTQLAQGAIPFGRSVDVRASLERVGDLVNDGFSVIVFPEGARSADGRMLPMREGIGLLATSLRIPVVPVHIEGAHEMLPKGAWLPSHQDASRIRIRFGTALHFDPDASVHHVTEQVREAMVALSEEAGRE